VISKTQREATAYRWDLDHIEDRGWTLLKGIDPSNQIYLKSCELLKPNQKGSGTILLVTEIDILRGEGSQLRAKTTHYVNVSQVFFKLSHQDWLKLSRRLECLTKNGTYHGVIKTMVKYSLISKKPSDKQARIPARMLMRFRKDDSRLPVISNLNNEDWKLIEMTGG
jgi:hypothetical protein